MKVYHVSNLKQSTIKLSPRIPDNFMTRNGYEDAKTKRVCVSISVDGALKAMSMNLKGKELHVYSAHVPEAEMYKPTTQEVPDVNITGERWIKKDVILNYEKSIVVGEAKDKEYNYQYGNNTATLYGWNYNKKASEHTNEIEKIAMNRWKKEYHNLSKENQDIIRKNVMKDSSDIARGVERGNQNLMRKMGIGEIIDDREFQAIRNVNGKKTIFSPTSLADFDVKNSSLSNKEKAIINTFNGVTGVKKLEQGDKDLFNAVSKRNAINKQRYGFAGQMIAEGSFSPYYQNQAFPKKLKMSRVVAYPSKQDIKSIFLDNKNKIDVRTDIKNQYKKSINAAAENIAKNKPFESIGIDGLDAVRHYEKNKKKFDNIVSSVSNSKGPVSKKLLAGVTAGAAVGGLGANHILKKKKKKQMTNDNE